MLKCRTQCIEHLDLLIATWLPASLYHLQTVAVNSSHKFFNLLQHLTLIRNIITAPSHINIPAYMYN